VPRANGNCPSFALSGALTSTLIPATPAFEILVRFGGANVGQSPWTCESSAVAWPARFWYFEVRASFFFLPCGSELTMPPLRKFGWRLLLLVDSRNGVFAQQYEELAPQMANHMKGGV